MTEDIVPIGEYVFDEPDVDMELQVNRFEILASEPDNEAVAKITVWHVTDTGRAEWAMTRLAEARDRLARRRAEHQAFVDRAAEWLKDASAQDERRVRWLEWELGEFGIAARTDQAKTVKLVSGAIATRESKPTVIVEDHDAFVEWFWESGVHGWPSSVVTEKTVHNVHLSELRKHCEPDWAGHGRVVDPETGEIIPGLGVSEGKITATVEPA